MKIHRRFVDQVAYAENAQRTVRLPRNYFLVGLDLMLIAKLSRSATTPDGGESKDSAPAQLIKNLLIRANGSDVLKSIDMETLHRKNELQYGTRPHIYSEAWSGYADKSEVTLKVAAYLPFAMPRAVREIDTILPTANKSSLDLIVTWGTGLDTMNNAYPGGGGSAESVTVHEATLLVHADEYIGQPPDVAQMMFQEFYQEHQVTAASNRFRIELPVGKGLLYRGLLLKTHSDGNQVDTILPFGLANTNTITLKSGTEVYLHEIAGCLQGANRLNHAIQVPERIGSAAALNHRLQELLLEGYYYIDFCRDGRLRESLDSSVLSDLILELEVAHPGTLDFVTVYPDTLLLPAVTTPAAT